MKTTRTDFKGHWTDFLYSYLIVANTTQSVKTTACCGSWVSTLEMFVHIVSWDQWEPADEDRNIFLCCYLLLFNLTLVYLPNIYYYFSRAVSGSYASSSSNQKWWQRWGQEIIFILEKQQEFIGKTIPVLQKNKILSVCSTCNVPHTAGGCLQQKNYLIM